MLRERSFAVCVAKAVSGFSYAELKVNFVEGFAVLCASHVSMASPFLASLFLWLRRFNGFAVSRFAVSMASPFLASLFLWLRRFNACGV